VNNQKKDSIRMGGFLSVPKEEPLQISSLSYNTVNNEVLNGKKEAKTELAALLLLGVGVEVDQAAAATLLQERVDDGDRRAMWMLGICCEYGIGVPQDTQKATELYERSAKLGCAAGKLLGTSRPIGERSVMNFGNLCYEYDDQNLNAAYESLLFVPWTTLVYHICPMDDKAREKVTHALKFNRSVQCLDFSGSFIRDSGATQCAELLKCNKVLKNLDLATCAITSQGAKTLAEALTVNTVLDSLTLFINDCRDDGVKYIAEALKTNTALTELDLRNNNVGDEGAKALGEALKTNSTLKVLYLGDNLIGDEGGKALNEALQTNTSIARLYISGNKFGDEMKDIIRATFESRRDRVKDGDNSDYKVEINPDH